MELTAGPQRSQESFQNEKAADEAEGKGRKKGPKTRGPGHMEVYAQTSGWSGDGSNWGLMGQPQPMGAAAKQCSI